MKTDEEIYEKFRWEIDNEKPDILFTDTMGWNDRKGVLDEDKVIRTYNRHLRKAISLTRKECEEQIKRLEYGYQKGKEDGQQAERKRILEMIDDMGTWTSKERLSIEQIEELKKEIQGEKE